MTQLATKNERWAQLSTFLTAPATLKQFQLAIRTANVKPEQIARIALTTVQSNPGLMDCDPRSIASAVVTACQLGLEPDNVSGLAYLVPFKNRKAGTTDCQLIVGYKGMIQLAYRSGQVATIEARVVYERDDFLLDWGATPPVRHIPTMADDTGEIIGFYAKVKLNTGGTQFEFMTVTKMKKHRDRFSKGAKRSDSPWQTDFETMGKKTVVRQICKWLPSSPELARATALDEQAEQGIPQHLDIIDVAPAGPPQTMDDVVQQAKAPEAPTQLPADNEPAPGVELPPIGKGELWSGIQQQFMSLDDEQKKRIRDQFNFKMITDVQKWIEPDVLDLKQALADAAELATSAA